MKRVLIAAGILAAVLLAGSFLFRHFVTDQITDKGGMENPYVFEETWEEESG